MSDFDAVLERLLVEPSFAVALAADPGAALLGYRLSPDEAALLHSQVTGDPGGHGSVEARANQSSVFGLLQPLAGMIGTVPVGEGGVAGTSAAGAGGGFATAAHAGAEFAGVGPSDQRHGVAAPPIGGGAFLPVAAVEGFGGVAATEGFGPVVTATEGFGPVVTATEGFGPAVPAAGRGPADPALPADAGVPAGYRTRVDADGDGRWDRHTLRGGPAGGVDILVDLDNDGRADFVGRDDDADGLVDSATYGDGVGSPQRRGFDDDGDGWLDRLR